MKNLKKLLAVIVTIAMIASLTVPVLADEEPELTDADVCEILGILKGSGEGVTEEYLGETSERYQAAIMTLRLAGLEEEAEDYTGEDNFDDADEIWAEGQNMLAY